MDHVFSAWPAIVQKLEQARQVLFLSDFDGTLAPIVDIPESAVLPKDTRRLLQRLTDRPSVSVGIVSGRSLPDLKRRVGIPGLVYAGNHGLEIEGPGIDFVSPLAVELRPVLSLIHLVLSRALASIKGVLVEDKGLSLSVHYRMVDPSQVHDVEQIVKKTVGPAEAIGKVRLAAGKKVHEIRPALDWNKGKAVRMLMKFYGKGGRRSGLVPVFLGDDITDEDAFEMIEAYGDGISVFVGSLRRPSAARYYLESTEEVGGLLRLLGESRLEERTAAAIWSN